MAGDWIKMRTDLFTHPKVVRMSSALKADTLRTVGGLMSAWCLFDAHSEDGRLEGYNPEVLDEHLRWNGFAAAMIAVGWLLYDDAGSLVLPRFDTHNGQSAKRRAQDADRKREVRKLSAPEADKQRTREEKRREEVDTPPDGGVGKLAPEGTPDQCPHQQIVALYHEHMPMCTRVKAWTETRKAALRARWREEPKRQNLDWWGKFFAYCAESPFLTGKTEPSAGRPRFKAELPWLLNQENMVKVIEGKYHQDVEVGE